MPDNQNPVAKKPYVRLSGKDPQGIPYNYKDLCKGSTLSEDQVESVISSTSVIQNLITPLSNSTPEPDGTADPGSSTEVSRSDHVHEIIADATTTSKGKVELATDGENAANVVVQGNDSRINKLTTKGDILTRDATDLIRKAVGANGTVLVSDSTHTSGLNWLTHAAMWFGSGFDGSSTLGSNTTLTARLAYCRNYTTLDLVSYTLTGNPGSGLDQVAVYCINTLLTGNGGSITPNLHVAPTGGAARVQGGSSGAGGNGGAGTAGVFVYARSVSGTLTIQANGRDGVAGGNASGTPTGTQTGATGNSVTNEVYFTATNVGGSTGTAGGGGGAAGGIAGIAGATPGVAETVAGYYDVMRYFLAARIMPIDNATPGTRAIRCIRDVGGNSGGSGGIASASAASGGGGGGGSLTKAVTSGVGGGAGGAGGGTIGAGGGGGGAGGVGGWVGVMVGEFVAAANLTVSANGGNGGNGGNGVLNGGGGGGGAGGNGGLVYCVFPVGYSAVTTSVTVTAGTKGTKGLKAGSGTDGNDGANGNAGTSAIMTWFG
jgi:hypothetical protein